MYTFLPQTIIWTHKSPCALERSAHSYHINQSFVYGHGPLLLPLAIIRSSQYIHSPLRCAPQGSSWGAQDTFVNAFSLPASGHFICQPPSLQA